MCLPAGSIIVSEFGNVPIETLNPGDAVLMADGKFGLITGVWSRRYIGNLIGVTVDTGKTCFFTTEHRIIVNGIAGAYVRADALKKSHSIQGREDGSFAKITKLNSKRLDGVVYNLWMPGDGSFCTEIGMVVNRYAR